MAFRTKPTGQIYQTFQTFEGFGTKDSKDFVDLSSGDSDLETGFKAEIKLGKSRFTRSSQSQVQFNVKSELKSVKKYRGKTYDELKAECLKEGTLFEDPDFRAIDSNVFFSPKAQEKFDWLRPGRRGSSHVETRPESLQYLQYREIMIKKKLSQIKPEFIFRGTTRFDVRQGEVGNCWFLAALACLSQHPKLMNVVVPPDQSFSENYAGIFKFNFWVFGQWKEVYVDDRLPTRGGELVFLHSTAQREFWSALLEKAYAKLVGSYEAMDAGSIGEAFEDFTGGVAEDFDLGPKASPNLLAIMMKATERESLMGCLIGADLPLESKLDTGLVTGHAYSITCIKIIDVKSENGEMTKLPMVRVRNPWGEKTEWKGKWSDSSEEWKSVSDEVKKELGLVVRDDGEFWMTFEDFKTNFTAIEVCHLSPECLEDRDPDTGEPKKKWSVSHLEGSWKKRLTAGGCFNHMKTFWINPQYHFEVIDPDEDDEKDEGTVIIGLMQKDRRRKHLSSLGIGFVIYQLSSPSSKPLDKEFFETVEPIEWSRSYIATREICKRFKLKPGHYCLVPSTFEPGEEADFLLRIFSEKPVPSDQLDDQTGLKEPEKEDLATKVLRVAFNKIAGPSLEIDAFQLREILNSVFKKELSFDGFSIETCRSLVATRDADTSGKLGFEEFVAIWNLVKVWKVSFKNHDYDKSGSFDSFELRKALNEIGVSVSNQTFNALVQRFSSRDNKVHFDDYVHMLARMSIMFDIFDEIKNEDETAVFTLDSFIKTTMYS